MNSPTETGNISPEVLAAIQLQDSSRGTVQIKPEYKLIALLTAQGLSDDTIATQLELKIDYVEKIKTRPWFLELLETALNALGKSKPKDLLEALEFDTIRTYRELMNDPNQSGAVRKSCADAILDRVKGKPVASIKVEEVDSISASENIGAELHNERKRLEAEFKKRGVSPSLLS